jgi:hypothetical protein
VIFRKSFIVSPLINVYWYKKVQKWKKKITQISLQIDVVKFPKGMEEEKGVNWLHWGVPWYQRHSLVFKVNHGLRKAKFLEGGAGVSRFDEHLVFSAIELVPWSSKLPAKTCLLLLAC